jgi:SH3 domain protein
VKKIVILLATLFLYTEAHAETVYVTDSFYAPMRSGKTNRYRIILNLKSGSPLTLISHDKESGYSNVRTPKGTEGWILTKDLINEPTAAYKLEALEKDLVNWKSDKQSVIQASAKLREDNAALSAANQALEKLNENLKTEVVHIKKISGNALNINQRNQELTEENQQLQNETDLLKAENNRLKDDTNHDFFLMGAGILGLGLVLGLIIPSLKPKRKDVGWI